MYGPFPFGCSSRRRSCVDVAADVLLVTHVSHCSDCLDSAKISMCETNLRGGQRASKMTEWKALPAKCGRQMDAR